MGALGQAVGLASDAKVIAVASPTNGAGVVRVIDFQQGTWVPENFTSSEPGARFGASVALSQNGTVLVIGAPGENSGQGQVHVYRRNAVGSPWNAHVLAPTEQDRPTGFGESIALSLDGAWLAVGAPMSNRVYYYDSLGSVWSSQRVLSKTSGQFGASLAYLPINAGVLVVGAPEQGAVHVFQGFGGEQPSNTSQITSGNPGDAFGATVSLSQDVLAIGALNTRAVYIYTGSATTWRLAQTLSGTVNGGFFATSVAVSANGNVLGVGAPIEGRVGLFTRAGSQFLLRWETMEVGGLFGSSIALNRSGTAVVVGDPNFNFPAGRARLFCVGTGC